MEAMIQDHFRTRQAMSSIFSKKQDKVKSILYLFDHHLTLTNLHVINEFFVIVHNGVPFFSKFIKSLCPKNVSFQSMNELIFQISEFSCIIISSHRKIKNHRNAV